jgi:hypothetical protein
VNTDPLSTPKDWLEPPPDHPKTCDTSKRESLHETYETELNNDESVGILTKAAHDYEVFG